MAIGDQMPTMGSRVVENSWIADLGVSIGEAVKTVIQGVAAGAGETAKQVLPVWAAGELKLGSQDQLRDPTKGTTVGAGRATPIQTTAGVIGPTKLLDGVSGVELAVLGAVALVGIFLLVRG